jgi:hypothetical protein
MAPTTPFRAPLADTSSFVRSTNSSDLLIGTACAHASASPHTSVPAAAWHHRAATHHPLSPHPRVRSAQRKADAEATAASIRAMLNMASPEPNVPPPVRSPRRSPRASAGSMQLLREEMAKLKESHEAVVLEVTELKEQIAILQQARLQD